MMTRHMTYRAWVHGQTQGRSGWYHGVMSRFTANFMDMTAPCADIDRRPLQNTRHFIGRVAPKE